MGNQEKNTVVIRNGTLIDGSGTPPSPNQAIVIEANRIKSIGWLSGEMSPSTRDHMQVIDAAGQMLSFAPLAPV